MARYILKRRPNSLNSVTFWYPTNNYVNDVSDSSNSTYISTVDPDSTIVYNFSSSQFGGTVENVKIRITAAATDPGYDYFDCYITVGGFSYGGTIYLDSTSYSEYVLNVGTPPVANQSFTLTITSGSSTVGIYISEIRVEIQVSDSQTSSVGLTDKLVQAITKRLSSSFGLVDLFSISLVSLLSSLSVQSLMGFYLPVYSTFGLSDMFIQTITKFLSSSFGLVDIRMLLSLYRDSFGLSDMFIRVITKLLSSSFGLVDIRMLLSLYRDSFGLSDMFIQVITKFLSSSFGLVDEIRQSRSQIFVSVFSLDDLVFSFLTIFVSLASLQTWITLNLPIYSSLILSDNVNQVIVKFLISSISLSDLIRRVVTSLSFSSFSLMDVGKLFSLYQDNLMLLDAVKQSIIASFLSGFGYSDLYNVSLAAYLSLLGFQGNFVLDILFYSRLDLTDRIWQVITGTLFSVFSLTDLFEIGLFVISSMLNLPVQLTLSLPAVSSFALFDSEKQTVIVLKSSVFGMNDVIRSLSLYFDNLGLTDSIGRLLLYGERLDISDVWGSVTTSLVLALVLQSQINFYLSISSLFGLADNIRQAISILGRSVFGLVDKIKLLSLYGDSLNFYDDLRKLVLTHLTSLLELVDLFDVSLVIFLSSLILQSFVNLYLPVYSPFVLSDWVRQLVTKFTDSSLGLSDLPVALSVSLFSGIFFQLKFEFEFEFELPLFSLLYFDDLLGTLLLDIIVYCSLRFGVILNLTFHSLFIVADSLKQNVFQILPALLGLGDMVNIVTGLGIKQLAQSILDVNYFLITSVGFDDILNVLLVEVISVVVLWAGSLVIFAFEDAVSLLDAVFKVITKKITSHLEVGDIVSEFIGFKTLIISNITTFLIFGAEELVVLNDLISGFNVSLFANIWNIVLVTFGLSLAESILWGDFGNFDVLFVSSTHVSTNIFSAIDSELVYAIVNIGLILAVVLDFQAGFALVDLVSYLMPYTNFLGVHSVLRLFVPLQEAMIGLTDSLNTLRVVMTTFLISLTDRWRLVFEGISRVGVGVGLALRISIDAVLRLSDKLRFFLRRNIVNLIEQRKLAGDILRGFHSQARASFGRGGIKEQFSTKSELNFAFSRVARREAFAASSKPSFAYKKKVTAYHEKAPNLPASFGTRFKF
jgi:hypothetical protein